jgi:hypothetical protein
MNCIDNIIIRAINEVTLPAQLANTASPSLYV